MLSTFFTFSTSSIDTMLEYTGDLVTDMTPLLLPIIAIGLGVIIVMAIIRAIRG